MRKINVYVVTYNNEERINTNVSRFFETTNHLDRNLYELKYHIINNHTNFKLDDKYKNYVTVWHNDSRPDFSCGHLARDYNSALMHGFVKLTNPQVDQVVCAQDDAIWNDNWIEDLVDIHKTYTFYSGDDGDNIHSYLPEAVRTIGIWDERFCNLGYHEADYLLRALIYNKDKSSLNDHYHGRVLNPTKVVASRPPHNNAATIHWQNVFPYHTNTRKLFQDKWNVYSELWHRNETPKGPLIDQYMTYPYFERDIYNLEEKRYANYICGSENFKKEWY